MATIVTPQTPEFKSLCADVYGDERSPAPLTADRQLYRETVASVVERAKSAMPEALHSRIDAGQTLVLSGDVELRPGGKAQVASQSNGATTYHVVNGACTCKDFPKALEGWCKHRLGAGIAKRVRQALALADTQWAAPLDDQPEPAPVKRAAVELTHDMQLLAPYVVTVHGQAFVKYAGLLALAHTRGLVSLKASFLSVTETLALATAEATFADGQTYSECADSTPQNVGVTVKAHFPRIALTRAKGRALRDALGVNMTALEELGE